MGIRIGSFNVKNLAYGNKGRDLDRIAKLLREMNCDIIALQEVLSEGKILTGPDLKSPGGQAKAVEYSLLHRMGGKWRCIWLDPGKSSSYRGEDKRGEGYAFLWNTARICLPTKANGEEILPRIWRQYSFRYVPYGETGLKLIRNPAIGRFRIKGLKMEIRIINTHIVYGKPSEENLAKDIDYGAVLMRKNEFSILAGQIYKRLDSDCIDEHCTSRRTILLGDYNLNLAKSGNLNATVPAVACFDERGCILPSTAENLGAGKNVTMYTLQSDLTTLKQSEPKLNNNFDHFTVGKNVLPHIVGPSPKSVDGVNLHVDAADQDDESKYNTYRTKVSDHLPITIELNLRGGQHDYTYYS